MFQVKIDNLTPREILFFYLTYENRQPRDVVIEVMQIKKTTYYNLKQQVEKEIERQRRRYIIANR